MPLLMLQTVLFPHASMHLHIVNIDQQQMLYDCDTEERSVGVVLLRNPEEQEPYLVGTAARITNLQTNADGSYNIQLRGERRFRIRRFAEEEAYAVGLVEPVFESEVLDQQKLSRILMRCRDAMQQLFSGYLAQIGARVSDIKFDNDPCTLSFLVANMLPMTELERQYLLENPDPLDRLESLMPRLEKQVLEATILPDLLGDVEEWIQPN